MSSPHAAQVAACPSTAACTWWEAHAKTVGDGLWRIPQICGGSPKLILKVVVQGFLISNAVRDASSSPVEGSSLPHRAAPRAQAALQQHQQRSSPRLQRRVFFASFNPPSPPLLLQRTHRVRSKKASENSVLFGASENSVLMFFSA